MTCDERQEVLTIDAKDQRVGLFVEPPNAKLKISTTGATVMNDLNLEGLSDKQLRLFAVRCARRVQHLMPDPRSIAALDVAERHANGQATDEELKVAREAAYVAWDAAWDVEDSAVQAANFAARVATRVARAATSAVALVTASDAAWATASDAASAAGSVAAGELDENSSCLTLQRWYAARDAERAEQQKILDEIRQEQPK